MSDQRFIKCFLLLKNVLNKSYVTTPLDVDVLTFSSGGGTYFNTTNNSLTVSYISNLTGVNGFINTSLFHNVVLIMSGVTSASATYYIDIYQNGVFYATATGVGTATKTITVASLVNVEGLNIVFTAKVRSTENISFNCRFRYIQTYNYFFNYDVLEGTATYNTTANTQTFSGNVDLATLAPDIKVSDFISGLTKEFNLTCYSTSQNVFVLQPLDEWYNSGAVVDVTKYTDIDSIDVDRIKLYKKISFKYQESESFMNKNFKSLFFRDYGNTELGYNYDGGEYSMEIPFENLLFNKFTGTDLQVGYHLNETFQSYVPKPTLLYMYDKKPCTFKFYNGTTTVTVSDYMPFGQDALIQGVNYSLNFSADDSSLLGIPIQQSLFAQYYFGYLTNLYNLKNRLINVKTVLPISLLTNLNLNDRLIIRDKRYIINEMKSNLTTGEVNFSLYLDFRPVNPAIIDSVPATAACYNYLVKVPVNSIATFTSSLGGVTINPSPLNSTGYVTVCIPVNTTGNQRTITITITINNRDGLTSLNSIFIIQAP